MTSCYISDSANSTSDCTCDDCGQISASNELHQIVDIEMRLTPGGVVPAGQCPNCGSLSYLTRVMKTTSKIIKQYTVYLFDWDADNTFIRHVEASNPIDAVSTAKEWALVEHNIEVEGKFIVDGWKHNLLGTTIDSECEISECNTRCPVCQSASIEGDSYDQDDNYVAQEMSCLDCEAEWNNVFTFNNVIITTPVTQSDVPHGA